MGTGEAIVGSIGQPVGKPIAENGPTHPELELTRLDKLSIFSSPLPC